MTIKEAFALLANKVGSGMKNPFFIARNLHDAFVEIEENISGGGEPTVVDAYDVTYQQSNVGAALDYINQGVQYSTTRERIVGKWTDGKYVYQKTFVTELNNIAAKTETNMADISGLNIDNVIDIEGSVNYYNGSIWYHVNLGAYFAIYAHSDGYLTFLQSITEAITNRTFKVTVTLKYTKAS